jgi:hypothetical protein
MKRLLLVPNSQWFVPNRYVLYLSSGFLFNFITTVSFCALVQCISLLMSSEQFLPCEMRWSINCSFPLVLRVHEMARQMHLRLSGSTFLTRQIRWDLPLTKLGISSLKLGRSSEVLSLWIDVISFS